MRLFSAVVGAVTFWAGAAMTTGASAAPVYFLVSEFPGSIEHGDSFVLPLTDEGDVAHARNLVLRGRSAGRPLVFADIVAGADQINRDILAAGKPAWSWHVTQFHGFADGGIELVDGWPTFIEQDVQGWINNTGGGTVDNDGDGEPDGNATVGRVGFWNYTVTGELAGHPTDLHLIARPAIPLPAALPAGAAMLALLGVAMRLRRSL